MADELYAFLGEQVPVAVESAVWGNGRLPLQVTAYLSHQLPPLDYVTSVRCVTLRREAVLVVRDPDGVHILPGGRRQSEETLLQTLHREVLEETGWRLSGETLLGFVHFHHLGPRPPDFPHLYPDFLQVVYTAEAEKYVPVAKEEDGYELSSAFCPLTHAPRLEIGPGERAFLETALQNRH